MCNSRVSAGNLQGFEHLLEKTFKVQENLEGQLTITIHTLATLVFRIFAEAFG